MKKKGGESAEMWKDYYCFLNYVFVGVFQYDPGPPELKDYVKYMFSLFISLFIIDWS